MAIYTGTAKTHMKASEQEVKRPHESIKEKQECQIAAEKKEGFNRPVLWHHWVGRT
jgi:hypothetical protein